MPNDTSTTYEIIGWQITNYFTWVIVDECRVIDGVLAEGELTGKEVKE